MINKEVSADLGIQEHGYLKCWTDGACADQGLPDLRRPGGGIYFGNQYLENMEPTQSSVLVELEGVESAIDIAWTKLEIVLD